MLRLDRLQWTRLWSRGMPIIIFAVAIAAFAAISSTRADEPLKLAGTLTIEQTRVSVIFSGNTGGGTLHFQGRDYPFSIGGLGIGGIGVTKLEATGTVYNMPDVSQFSGVYSSLRSGFAVGDTGKGKLWLKNGSGVVMQLVGANKGVGLTLGADAVRISFR